MLYYDQKHKSGLYSNIPSLLKQYYSFMWNKLIFQSLFTLNSPQCLRSKILFASTLRFKNSSRFDVIVAKKALIPNVLQLKLMQWIAFVKWRMIIRIYSRETDLVNKSLNFKLRWLQKTPIQSTIFFLECGKPHDYEQLLEVRELKFFFQIVFLLC